MRINKNIEQGIYILVNDVKGQYNLTSELNIRGIYVEKGRYYIEYKPLTYLRVISIPEDEDEQETPLITYQVQTGKVAGVANIEEHVQKQVNAMNTVLNYFGSNQKYVSRKNEVYLQANLELDEDTNQLNTKIEQAYNDPFKRIQVGAYKFYYNNFGLSFYLFKNERLVMEFKKPDYQEKAGKVDYVKDDLNKQDLNIIYQFQDYFTQGQPVDNSLDTAIVLNNQYRILHEFVLDSMEMVANSWTEGKDIDETVQRATIVRNIKTDISMFYGDKPGITDRKIVTVTDLKGDKSYSFDSFGVILFNKAGSDLLAQEMMTQSYKFFRS